MYIVCKYGGIRIATQQFLMARLIAMRPNESNAPAALVPPLSGDTGNPTDRREDPVPPLPQPYGAIGNSRTTGRGDGMPLFGANRGPRPSADGLASPTKMKTFWVIKYLNIYSTNK